MPYHVNPSGLGYKVFGGEQLALRVWDRDLHAAGLSIPVPGMEEREAREFGLDHFFRDGVGFKL